MICAKNSGCIALLRACCNAVKPVIVKSAFSESSKMHNVNAFKLHGENQSCHTPIDRIDVGAKQNQRLDRPAIATQRCSNQRCRSVYEQQQQQLFKTCKMRQNNKNNNNNNNNKQVILWLHLMLHLK